MPVTARGRGTVGISPADKGFLLTACGRAALRLLSALRRFAEGLPVPLDLLPSRTHPEHPCARLRDIQGLGNGQLMIRVNEDQLPRRISQRHLQGNFATNMAHTDNPNLHNFNFLRFISLHQPTQTSTAPRAVFSLMADR